MLNPFKNAYTNTDYDISKIFVSRYWNRSGYDFDSIIVQPNGKRYKIIDSIKVRHKISGKFHSQILTSNNGLFFKKIENKSANKFFYWNSDIVSLDFDPLDDQRLMKTYLLKYHDIIIYSKKNRYEKRAFTDTSKIIIKLQYGGLKSRLLIE